MEGKKLRKRGKEGKFHKWHKNKNKNKKKRENIEALYERLKIVTKTFFDILLLIIIDFT